MNSLRNKYLNTPDQIFNNEAHKKDILHCVMNNKNNIFKFYIHRSIGRLQQSWLGFATSALILYQHDKVLFLRIHTHTHIYIYILSIFIYS